MSKYSKKHAEENIKEDSSKESSKIQSSESLQSETSFVSAPVNVTAITEEKIASLEVEVTPPEEAKPEAKKQRLALFYKRFVLSRPVANIAKSFNKVYEAKSYITDDVIIDELIEKNAPIGISERVN
mgnify:FL=1